MRLLAQTRRHDLSRRTILALVWLAAAAVLAFAVARLLPVGALGRLTPWTFAGLAALLAGGVIAAVIGRTGASPERTARRIETQLDLSERLSSSLEVQRGRPGQCGPLVLALVRDADIHAARVDPRALRPLMGRDALRAAGALAFALLLAALSLALPPAGPEAGPGPEARSPGGGAGTASAGATVEAITQMAQLVGSDSQMRDSDLLDAAAYRLRQLARDAGIGLSQQELDERLAGLIDMARTGYADTPPSWLPRADEDMATLGERISDYRRELAARAEAAAAARAPAQGSDRPGAALDADIPLGEAAAMLEGPREGEGEGAGDMGTPLPRDFAPMAEQSVRASHGMPVGAAAQAGRGEGDMAGLGSQPLTGGEAPPLLGPEAGEEMILTADRTIAGNRVRIEAALPAEDGATAPRDDVHALRTSDRLTADVVSREPIGSAERPVVARYFSPLGTLSGSGP